MWGKITINCFKNKYSIGGGGKGVCPHRRRPTYWVYIDIISSLSRNYEYVINLLISDYLMGVCPHRRRPTYWVYIDIISSLSRNYEYVINLLISDYLMQKKQNFEF